MSGRRGMDPPRRLKVTAKPRRGPVSGGEVAGVRQVWCCLGTRSRQEHKEKINRKHEAETAGVRHHIGGALANGGA